MNKTALAYILTAVVVGIITACIAHSVADAMQRNITHLSQSVK